MIRYVTKLTVRLSTPPPFQEQVLLSLSDTSLAGTPWFPNDKAVVMAPFVTWPQNSHIVIWSVSQSEQVGEPLRK